MTRPSRGDFGRIVLVEIFLLTLTLLGGETARGQASPGSYADSDHPSGPVGPMKNDDIWHLDPLTGAVTIHIPFTTTPVGARGPSFPFGLSYNSASTVLLRDTGIFGTDSGQDDQIDNYCLGDGECVSWVTWTAAGDAENYDLFAWEPPISTWGPTGPWTVTGPYLTVEVDQIPDMELTTETGQVNQLAYIYGGYGCTIAGPFTYTDETGAAHDMNLIDVEQEYGSTTPQAGQTAQNGYTPACRPPNYGNGDTPSSTWDGSALLTSYSDVSGKGLQGTVVYPDGTKFIGTTSNNVASGTWSNNELEDSNGNVASPSLDSLGRPSYVTNLPVGQAGPIPAGTYTVTTYNASGNSQVYTITVSTIPFGSYSMPHPTDSEISDMPNCWWGINCPQYNGVTPPSGSITAITQIALPDGQSYQFQYDTTYATISRIIFPSGGYVRFEWGTRNIANVNIGRASALSSLVAKYVYVSPSGSGTEAEWQYSYPDLSNNQLTTNEIAPTFQNTVNGQIITSGGTKTTYTAQPFNYSEFSYDPFSNTVSAPTWQETMRSISNSSGILKETIQTNYVTNSSYGYGKPSQIATTMYDGSSPIQEQVQYKYDLWGNVTERDESDWYSCGGSPCPAPASPPNGWLRQTFTQYAYQNAYPPNTSAESTALTSAHIVDKPSRVFVTDGSGNPASLTFYAYDEAGHIGNAPTGISTHDDQNYGAGSTLARGDLTTKTRCITISGSGASATCGTSWQTSYYYDLTGQVTQKVDGSNTSASASTGYTWDGQDDGFLHYIQYPNGLKDTYTYYTPTGQIDTYLDWNNELTTYSYADNGNMGRLSGISYPDTGSSSFYYDDAVPSIQTTLATGEASGNIVKTSTYDGLGRLVETQMSRDPDGADNVDTTYDPLGRVYSVSNPYRGSGASSFTYSFYDDLGRPTTQFNQDNSSKIWMYAGNQTTFTDENGNEWLRTTDGLGRLTQVQEPNGSSRTPSLTTNYTYDPLGDLVTAGQLGSGSGTLSRGTFVYDALGRLTSAPNPETGTVGYSYSVPGDACASDPSLPCSMTDARGVTTSYGYDNVNHLISRTYSGTVPAGSLSSCFQYGTSTTGNQAGRLIAEWTQAGSCPQSPPSSGFQSLRKIGDYDAMGRITSEQQCVLTFCTSSSPPPPPPSNCTSLPAANGLTYCYDLAGAVTAYSNGLTSTSLSQQNILFSQAFDAAGRLSSVSSSLDATQLPPNLFIVNPSSGYSPFGALENWSLGNKLNANKSYDSRLRVTGETVTQQ